MSSPFPFLIRATLALGLVLTQAAAAEDPSISASRLEQLQGYSLEDLLVTSVSKKEEKAFGAAASISVIQGDEIRRAGIRNLPDAFRLAPGVRVARLDANKWSISTRGFSSRFSQKLLVLVDGRAVYSPSFSGVYWLPQNLMLEDVERIEIIRGPGGTLWGANAVNGVINIITKSSTDTTGTYLTGGGGNESTAFGGARYGAALGKSGFIRLYGQYDSGDSGALTDRVQGRDEWWMTRLGSRADWELQGNNSLTLQGDYYYGHEGTVHYYPAYRAPFVDINSEEIDSKGANVLGRWTHTFENGTDMQLQTYWDQLHQLQPAFRYRVDTYDVDFQHRIQLPWDQELMYGLGYRLWADEAENQDPSILFFPPSRNYQLFSSFIQDEIKFFDERVRFIVGTKFEHADYTGFEIQPNARLAWTPTENQTLWGAISRAVRTPSRYERDGTITVPADISGNIPAFVRGFPTDGLRSEKLIAYELGYRVRPIEPLTFDSSAYYFDYEDLVSYSAAAPPYPGTEPGDPHFIAPFIVGNSGRAKAYGFELSVEYELTDWWRLRGGYSLLKFNEFHPPDPSQQILLRSSMDLPADLSLDLFGRWTDEVNYPPGGTRLNVEAFFDLDVRLGWRPQKNLELAIVGHNLIQARHFETDTPGYLSQPSQVERGVYAQLSIRY